MEQELAGLGAVASWAVLGGLWPVACWAVLGGGQGLEAEIS